MKRFIKNIGACLIALILAISPMSALPVGAAEDATPPQLVSVEVLSDTVKAGGSFQVRIKVKESETGLVRAIIQFNDKKLGMVTAYEDKTWETPVYSSGQSYIEYTFTIPTRKDFIGGDWYVGHLQFFDQKGNHTDYFGVYNSGESKLYSDSFKPQHNVFGKIHTNVTDGAANVLRPVINSVKILNPTVEKNQNLKIELNVTSTEPIVHAALYLYKNNMSDEFYPSTYDIPQGTGTQTFTIEIPIDSTRHIGDWEIQDLRLYDAKNNEAHYTNQLTGGYFADYYKESPGKFDLLKFNITGVAGDETAPVPNSIKVLNDELTVTKPGILYLQIDITEEGTGVSCVDLKYLPIEDSQEVLGRLGWSVIGLKEYDTNGGYDIFTTIDKPLKTGTHTLEVPIPSTILNGEYRMHVELTDGADNKSHQSFFDKVYADFFVKDEFDYKFELGITNGGLLSSVKNLKEGEAGKILLSSNSSENVLSKEILDAIANQKKNLVCYRDGYQWIIDGKKIQPHKTKDINLTTRIYVVEGKYLSSGKQAIALSFANNGKLPGNIEFRFKSAFIRDFFGKEELLQLYHVEHPEKGYEEDIDYIQSDYARIPDNQAMFKIVLENSKDAWCSVNLNHNSKYVVSDQKLTKLSSKQVAALQGNSSKNNAQSSELASSTASDEETSSQTDNTVSDVISSQPTAPKKENDPVGIVVIIVVCIVILTAALFMALPKTRNLIKKVFDKMKK